MIYLNNKPLNVTIFPDNTSQVWKLDQINLTNDDKITVKWEFSHEGEFLHLAQLKDLLDIHQIESYLEIKYLPYARQDKEISNTSTFALRTFAKLLNSLNFNEVQILDPHSYMALKLINNSTIKRPEIREISKLLNVNLVCFPDRGALSRYYSYYIQYFEDYITGEKIRDPLTGKIISYGITNNNIKDKKILIVDDICDGGATFIQLTEKLLAQEAKEVNLFVTHGIFSKGLKVLQDSGINRIFTVDGEASEIQNTITYRRL